MSVSDPAPQVPGEARGRTAAAPVLALAPEGVGEVAAGTDLADLLLAALAGLGEPGRLREGDVVVVTSKVVSKAEGRVVPGTREEHLATESRRLVARRGPTSIVRTRHGLTMAAAGIDASNVALGSCVLLPLDPDASARALRGALRTRTGLRRLGVVVTDTAGRAWREGQTDIAIGAAGLRVLEDFAGRVDAHGNELAVTAPAVADEIAGLAELASGKLGGRPFVLVRGRADLLTDDDGPGATALVRAEGGDLFGYGARQAVIAAVARRPEDRTPFGAPVPAEELVAALDLALGAGTARTREGAVLCRPGRPDAVAAVAFAHGWELQVPGGAPGDLRLHPLGP
ncbi:coenzyme F420-0:L-glutamate ligase [Nocardioides sp.]|uniref:coenzyme F420-0:L-glutamate ligase n=1 Tax=Nocardioides sp. TaxID=35761 RepID=UPI0035143BE5